MEGYKLQETKSVIFQLQTSKKNQHLCQEWTLGDKLMSQVESNPHMGITRTSKNQEMNSVLENIQKARKAIYSLMASGLHGENGLDPESSLSMLQSYVLPVLTYGLEVIVPINKALATLEIQYKKIIKQILSLPSNTADPAVYILSGTIPLEAVIHKKVLMLFGNIMRLPGNSIENRLATHQLEHKSLDSHSWFIVVKKLFIKYDFPEIEEILDTKYEKRQWKNIVDKYINQYWTMWIVSQASLYSSLQYISKTLVLGKCHPSIKPYQKSIRDVNRIPVKTKILTGTYILQTTRVKFNQNEIIPTCQICKIEDETLEHFLLKCGELKHFRDPVMQDILQLIKDLKVQDQNITQYSLLQLIIDCHIAVSDKSTPLINELLEKLQFYSRRLCYTLHAARYKKLELIPKKRKGRRR
jgi:hypothetical protein